MAILKYKKALQTVKKHNPVPITLVIGDKRFEGVEFRNTTVYGDDRDNHNYDTWLLIQAPKKDIRFLSHDLPDAIGLFHGRSFDLFGEVHGDDFIFMGKAPKTTRDRVEWSRAEWKEYVNHPVECQIIY